jgi:hypothetical protein
MVSGVGISSIGVVPSIGTFGGCCLSPPAAP